MMPLSRWGANQRVQRKLRMEMRPSYHWARQEWRKPETLIRPMTAIMMIAASTDWGRW